MKRLFLLDAYALIYRAYYAFLKFPRVNSKGFNTSAIFGFVNTLEDLLKREHPTHLAVVFDPAGPTFRHEAYEKYKANREATPEDIRKAVPYIKQIVEAYRIPVIEVAGYEADDVIGTMSGMAERAGFEVMMMTPDKDYGQLVTEHVKIYKPRFAGSGFDTLGVEEVLAKWDLKRTEQVIDILGLMGDAADNIPGCPGVGEKTAMKLLKEFDSIENLLNNSDKLKGALQKKVIENAEEIRFSRFLATIKIDVPVEFDEEKLIVEQPDVEKLVEIFTELEFRSHINKLLGGGDEASAKTKTSARKTSGGATLFDDPDTGADDNLNSETVVAQNFVNYTTVAHKYLSVDSLEACRDLAKRLSESAMFCFDTETTSVDAMRAELVGISFAIEEHEAYYVPISPERDKAQAQVEIFREAFGNELIEKSGQNMKYDLLVLGNYGIEVRGKLFDTMVAHYLLQPELRHGMDYLAEIYLNYKTIHIEELIGTRGKDQLNMRQVAVEKVVDYAAEDADITLQLRNILQPKLAEMQMQQLFDEVEMPLVRVLADMERKGVLIDDFALAHSQEVLNANMMAIEREIREIAGEPINVSSPKQVGEFLFDKLHLVDKPRRTKTGQYVTDEETLESLRAKHEVVGKILDYRGLKKLLSTYIEALPKLINPTTGRVHTSFNQTVTATGRLSSSNPNLQNIPIRDDKSREIRRAFVAPEGYIFLSADYSQVELRIMAHLSGDKNMVEAFQHDHDIHQATAANIYKVSLDEVTSDMRRKAKTANFGIIYGISAFGLSERLSIPRGEAKQLIDDYFATFSGVHQYMQQSIEQAREAGYVETALHRRRYLPDLKSRNANVRNYAERNAINSPIQGLAADIIKIAMVRIAARIQREGLRTEMVLQVHDELNFNVPLDEVEQVRELVRQEMEGAYPLSVPLRVEIGEGQNWLEAH